ncbi:heat shock factor protein-like [Parasteatoda tepidariorum]|uniref:heat shock factor protein-like n=1 Tax=Parasteatoda tepidariorum TaxID=114398 RepID=UPI001C7263F3|nr:heat shock factor protein-like [Parasteatoda tepidariorum]
MPSLQRFQFKLYKIVNSPKVDSVIWNKSGNGIVFDLNNFKRNFLDINKDFCKSNKIASFIRQLNLYGFKKTTDLRTIRNKRHLHEFKNPWFLRGREDLLNNVSRNHTHLSKNTVSQRKKSKRRGNKRRGRPIHSNNSGPTINKARNKMNKSNSDLVERNKNKETEKKKGHFEIVKLFNSIHQETETLGSTVAEPKQNIKKEKQRKSPNSKFPEKKKHVKDVNSVNITAYSSTFPQAVNNRSTLVKRQMDNHIENKAVWMNTRKDSVYRKKRSEGISLGNFRFPFTSIQNNTDACQNCSKTILPQCHENKENVKLQPNEQQKFYTLITAPRHFIAAQNVREPLKDIQERKDDTLQFIRIPVNRQDFKFPWALLSDNSRTDEEDRFKVKIKFDADNDCELTEEYEELRDTYLRFKHPELHNESCICPTFLKHI